MRLSRRTKRHPAAAAAALAVLSAALLITMSRDASSQAARVIRIVVPFPPGGPTDTLARLLAEQISRAQRATFAVENRPGASSVIGTEAVSRAAPDGATLLINSPAFLINPHLQKLDYDPLNGFEPVCHLVNSPTVVVVSGASPFRSLADLIGAARGKPGELTLASVGPGSVTQIAFEALKRAAKVDMTFIPYPGMAPAATAVMGEHVSSGWLDYAQAGEQVKSGKLRALAAAAGIAALPDVPTIAELGYNDVDADPWFGVVAPAKTPKETVAQLGGWFAAALQDPEVKNRLAALGFRPVGTCGADFAAFMLKQSAEYGRVIREANIKAQ
jgi:tripartite-type tricarboxylate transporter receptor subunit TctC